MQSVWGSYSYIGSDLNPYLSPVLSKRQRRRKELTRVRKEKSVTERNDKVGVTFWYEGPSTPNKQSQGCTLSLINQGLEFNF